MNAQTRYVCGKCLDDEALQDFCADKATRKKCDFCGRKSAKLIAAPLEEVIEWINVCVHQHYDDPANWLGWNNEEGGYLGTTYDSWEVLEEMGLELPHDDGELLDVISKGLDNDIWCEHDPYGLSQKQRLSFSWDKFCKIIKHERRFFFLGGEAKGAAGDELLSPAKILEAMFSYAEDAGAFSALPAGTKVFRARPQSSKEAHTTAGALGPPPVERATQTNRMSPPGIVMTYVSEDRLTALAETAAAPGDFAIGEFVIDRPLLILDFTQLPPIPSLFAELSDSLPYDPRPRLQFLYQLSREISRPIARDDRVHVEYVPTQVVTEYVRTNIRIKSHSVDGIRYRSSRKNSKHSLVLFADQSNLHLEGDERPEFYKKEGRWLRLRKSTVAQVTKAMIQTWKT